MANTSVIGVLSSLKAARFFGSITVLLWIGMSVNISSVSATTGGPSSIGEPSFRSSTNSILYYWQLFGGYSGYPIPLYELHLDDGRTEKIPRPCPEEDAPDSKCYQEWKEKQFQGTTPLTYEVDLTKLKLSMKADFIRQEPNSVFTEDTFDVTDEERLVWAIAVQKDGRTVLTSEVETCLEGKQFSLRGLKVPFRSKILLILRSRSSDCYEMSYRGEHVIGVIDVPTTETYPKKPTPPKRSMEEEEKEYMDSQASILQIPGEIFFEAEGLDVARVLNDAGYRCYKKGFLKCALSYFRVAHDASNAHSLSLYNYAATQAKQGDIQSYNRDYSYLSLTELLRDYQSERATYLEKIRKDPDFTAMRDTPYMKFLTAITYRPFTDVPTLHANADAIGYLASHALVSGNPDGTFHPDALVNRAEFTTLLLRFKNEPVDANEKNCFPDVLNQWFAPAVCTAKKRGFVAGHPDGTFHPSDPVNAAEVAKMIGLRSENEARDPWYLPWLRALSDKKALPITIKKANQSVTRGEIAEILFRLHANVTDRPAKEGGF